MAHGFCGVSRGITIKYPPARFFGGAVVGYRHLVCVAPVSDAVDVQDIGLCFARASASDGSA